MADSDVDLARDPFAVLSGRDERGGSVVHVFQVALPSTWPALGDARLSARENQRAARFVFEVHRAQYVGSHLALRVILGRCLRVAPAAVRFDEAIGAGGKPRLLGAEVGDLQFNLSHTDGWALIAVTRGRAVGVDIEGHAAIERAAPEIEFSPAEQQALAELPPDARKVAWHRLWVRKEAYLKATGQGIVDGLGHFDVSVGVAATLLATRPDPTVAAAWRLLALPAPAGYEAALAYAYVGSDAQVRAHVIPWSAVQADLQSIQARR